MAIPFSNASEQEHRCTNIKPSVIEICTQARSSKLASSARSVLAALATVPCKFSSVSAGSSSYSTVQVQLGQCWQLQNKLIIDARATFKSESVQLVEWLQRFDTCSAIEHTIECMGVASAPVCETCCA